MRTKWWKRSGRSFVQRTTRWSAATQRTCLYGWMRCKWCWWNRGRKRLDSQAKILKLRFQNVYVNTWDFVRMYKKDPRREFPHVFISFKAVVSRQPRSKVYSSCLTLKNICTSWIIFEKNLSWIFLKMIFNVKFSFPKDFEYL